MPERLLDCAELARILNSTPRTVRTWLREGRIPAYRIGGEYRIDAEQLNRWLEKQAVVTTEA